MFSCIFKLAHNFSASPLSPHHFSICISRIKAVVNCKSNPTSDFREIVILLPCYSSKTDSQFKLSSFRLNENYSCKCARSFNSIHENVMKA